MNIKNNITLMGRIATDLVLAKTANGIEYCNFSVAVDRPYRKGEERKTDFIKCQAWRNTADFIVRYFKKGLPILMQGSLHQNDYVDKNNVKHYSFLVAVNDVDFPLNTSKNNDNNDNVGSSEPALPDSNFELLNDDLIPPEFN